MVDALDLKILGLLETDGSFSYTELARKLRLNESTIRKRILSMKNRGVIKKFSVVLALFKKSCLSKKSALCLKSPNSV